MQSVPVRRELYLGDLYYLCPRNQSAAHIKQLSQNIYERGIKPEELQAAEDIKKLEHRVASEEKKIEKTSSKLPK